MVPELVEQVAHDPLVTSVRVRLTDSFGPSGGDGDAVEHLAERLRLLADAELVATIETSADRLASVVEVAGQLPELRIVVDHLGWPSDLSTPGRRAHQARLASLAAEANVATRIDAIGTIFGDWTVEQIRPWLEGAVEAFGAARCMLGSDLPIETLRLPFERPLRRLRRDLRGVRRGRAQPALQGYGPRLVGSPGRHLKQRRDPCSRAAGERSWAPTPTM